MRHFFLTTVLLISVAMTGGASLAQSGTTDVKLNDGPVSIEADQLDVNQEARRAVFTGRVHVVQGDFKISTREIIVEYGPGGPQDLNRLTARYHVVINLDDARAEGNRAVYNARSEVLVVSGNVTYKSGTSVLTGSKLTINFAKGTTNMTSTGGSGGGGRVKGVFSPKAN